MWLSQIEVKAKVHTKMEEHSQAENRHPVEIKRSSDVARELLHRFHSKMPALLVAREEMKKS